MSDRIESSTSTPQTREHQDAVYPERRRESARQAPSGDSAVNGDPGGTKSRHGARLPGRSRPHLEEQSTAADKAPAKNSPTGHNAERGTLGQAIAGQDSPLRPNLPDAARKVQEAKDAATKLAAEAASKLREVTQSPAGKVVEGVLKADRELGKELRQGVLEWGPAGQAYRTAKHLMNSGAETRQEIEANKNLTDKARAMRALDQGVKQVPFADSAENLRKAQQAIKSGDVAEGVNQSVQGAGHFAKTVAEIAAMRQAGAGARGGSVPEAKVPEAKAPGTKAPEVKARETAANPYAPTERAPRPGPERGPDTQRSPGAPTERAPRPGPDSGPRTTPGLGEPANPYAPTERAPGTPVSPKAESVPGAEVGRSRIEGADPARPSTGPNGGDRPSLGHAREGRQGSGTSAGAPEGKTGDGPRSHSRGTHSD